ncbi:unnamed protein product [Timema podura]|uniref:Uncharacterized protein n=1 Tax=Timema podura TaxID=61482 RepID=A0ABN7P1J2_TIMPD|nr:unnamed protein product [Timema podura]
MLERLQVTSNVPLSIEPGNAQTPVSGLGSGTVPLEDSERKVEEKREIGNVQKTVCTGGYVLRVGSWRELALARTPVKDRYRDDRSVINYATRVYCGSAWLLLVGLMCGWPS